VPYDCAFTARHHHAVPSLSFTARVSVSGASQTVLSLPSRCWRESPVLCSGMLKKNPDRPIVTPEPTGSNIVLNNGRANGYHMHEGFKTPTSLASNAAPPSGSWMQGFAEKYQERPCNDAERLPQATPPSRPQLCFPCFHTSLWWGRGPWRGTEADLRSMLSQSFVESSYRVLCCIYCFTFEAHNMIGNTLQSSDPMAPFITSSGCGCTAPNAAGKSHGEVSF
jgi:hypothetical protein